MDIFLGGLMLICLIWGFSLYNDENSNCEKEAPIHYFFLALFVHVLTIVIGIVILALITTYCKIFFMNEKAKGSEGI